VYHVYILQCRDGSLYAGIAKDLKKRMDAHAAGRGSKYVRSRLPFSLVYSEKFNDRMGAAQREAEIKAMSKARKTRLIAGVNKTLLLAFLIV